MTIRCWDSERITGNDKGVNCSFSLFFVCMHSSFVILIQSEKVLSLSTLIDFFLIC